MKRYLTLILMVAVSTLGMACSSEEGSQRDPEDWTGSGKQTATSPAQTTVTTPQETTAQQEETEGVGLGEVVEVGDLRIRAFDVRSEDTVHFMSGPGAPAASRESFSGEYVAIDYVGENASDSSLTTEVEARLEDAQGNSHVQDDSIEPPGGGTDGMQLDPGQKKASTIFFDVPGGTTPELLTVRSSGEEASIDLTQGERGEIPPEDYLYVYHLYFNERAYEEAYAMLDPSSMQGVTLGDWLAFYEPLWGQRYISLDAVSRVSAGFDQPAFEIDRTFYGPDGSLLSDPELNAPVTQEMIRDGVEWKLVMREDLVEDILPAKSSPTATATPEPTTVEHEETETLEEDLYDCGDFSTQAEAQVILDQDLTDPYGLDGDGDLEACEDLPGNDQYESSDPPPEFNPDPDRDDHSGRQRRRSPEASRHDLAPSPTGRDVDCDELGPGEAQRYLLPGDPHDLDRDNDGKACE
jgi:hypothetical protein